VVVTVLRWTVGVIAGLLVFGALFGLVVSVAFENHVWAERTRRMRAWIYVVGLAWFNLEIWGRVVYTLVTWGR
jgi:hypothetical protein